MANQPTENDDPLKDWLNSMQTLLKSVDHDYIQSCSISIVPEGLKRSNEDAYTPRVVSMGPRHKGSREDLLLRGSVNSCCGFLRNCFGGILIWLGSLIVTAKPEAAEEEDARGLDFGFKFRKGKLEIAQLHITKTTKAKWRNVIAWEHHKKNSKSSSAVSHTGYESGDDQNNQSMMTTSPDPTPSGKFTLSALIFDGLICCAADVKILKDKNIIVDHMKMSNGEVEEFFRTMSFGVDKAVVDDGSSYYVKMVDDLNNYSEAFFLVRICKTGWHLFTYRLVWLVKFMTRNYNFVATVLAALNVVQAVYVILAFYLRE